MRVVVNGEEKEVGAGATVQQLIESMGLGAATIVVQRNDEIVERTAFAETAIEEGDRLELIRLVGGG
jgi:thiamine biosynthesis protein ThiS